MSDYQDMLDSAPSTQEASALLRSRRKQLAVVKT